MKSSLLSECIIYLTAPKPSMHTYIMGLFVKATSGCILAAPIVKPLLCNEAGYEGLCTDDIISYYSNSERRLLLCTECHSKEISKLYSVALKLRIAFLSQFFPEAPAQEPCGG